MVYVALETYEDNEYLAYSREETQVLSFQFHRLLHEIYHLVYILMRFVLLLKK
jgi:hypothetical protein